MNYGNNVVAEHLLFQMPEQYFKIQLLKSSFKRSPELRFYQELYEPEWANLSEKIVQIFSFGLIANVCFPVAAQREAVDFGSI